MSIWRGQRGHNYLIKILRSHHKNASWAITNTLETKEKTESLSKEIEDSKCKMEVLLLKNTVAKIKSSVMGYTAEWRAEKKESMNEKINK